MRRGWCDDVVGLTRLAKTREVVFRGVANGEEMQDQAQKSEDGKAVGRWMSGGWGSGQSAESRDHCAGAKRRGSE